MYRKVDQPASCTDLDIRVRPSRELETSPTKIAPCSRTSLVESLWCWSLLMFAIFSLMARTRSILRARCATTSLSSQSRYVRGAETFSPLESVARDSRPRSIPTADVAVEGGSSAIDAPLEDVHQVIAVQATILVRAEGDLDDERQVNHEAAPLKNRPRARQDAG